MVYMRTLSTYTIIDEMGYAVWVAALATTWTEVGTEEPLAGDVILTPAKQETAEATRRNRFKTVRKLTSRKRESDEWGSLAFLLLTNLEEEESQSNQRNTAFFPAGSIVLSSHVRPET